MKSRFVKLINTINNTTNICNICERELKPVKEMLETGIGKYSALELMYCEKCDRYSPKKTQYES